MQKVAILDVDGVLLDVTPGLISYVQEKHNYKITEEDITDYDWDYCLGLPEGVPEDVWEMVWAKPALVYPGAIDFIQALKNRGYWVQGLSKRLNKNAVLAVERDFPQLGLDHWVLEKNKAQWILDNMPNAEFIVEDHNKNAVSIGSKTDLDVYFFNRPWNERCITVTDAWKRVYSYQDVLRAIDSGPGYYLKGY